MENLNCLVYTSLIDVHCTKQDIDHILEKARHRNKEVNITGILVHTHRHFMQYIEGPSSQICALFKKIKGDQLHHDILLCHFSTIANRAFPDWHMGYKDLKNKQLTLNTATPDVEKETLDQFLDQFQETPFTLETLELFL